ncbi:MAG: sodium:calcium antiporter [Haloferacaceae archaeon]
MATLGPVVSWFVALFVSAWVADWGARRLAHPLRKLRRQQGLTGTAGGALLAVVTAAPEIGINSVSALRDVSDIGLGNLLGSNIVSIPLVFTTAYLASRRTLVNGPGPDRTPDADPPDSGERFLRLEPRTLSVHVLPYLAILALLAALTLPSPGSGLQPVDGWVMLAAYAVYLSQAVVRGRESGADIAWERRELAGAATGVAAVVDGAFFAVRSTERLVALLGIPDVVGGLFITATVSTVPEMFNTWQVVRSGQVTAGTTSVLADNTATVTLGFLPLALVSAPVANPRLYWVNLLFVGLIPGLLAVLLRLAAGDHGLKRRQILLLDGAYVGYLLVVALLFLDVT